MHRKHEHDFAPWILRLLTPWSPRRIWFHDCAGVCGLLVGLWGALATQADLTSSSPEGLGHLVIRSVSPGHFLRPNAAYPDVEPLARGQWQLRIGATLGNVWLNRPEGYQIDGEWINTDLVLSHAVTESIRVSIGLPIMQRGGGFADAAIESFHKTFNLGNANRENYPRNQVRMEVLGPGGERFLVEESAWGIGDIPIYVSSRLTHPNLPHSALFLQMGVTLPTGDESELFGLGHLLWGGSLFVFHRLGESPWHVFAGGSLSHAPTRHFVGITMHREETSGLVGLQYRISESTALIIQYLATSPVAKDYFTFSDWTHEVQIGLKRRLNARLTLQGAIIENVFRFSNSADVGLHLGLSYQF